MLYFSTPLAYTKHWFTFIESSVFERVRAVYLDDDEYSELQQFLNAESQSRGAYPWLRWRSQGALDTSWDGKAWRAPHHLLCAL